MAKIISIQRGTSVEEKLCRQELREQIIALGMKFMLTDDDIDTIAALQQEYYALLAFGHSEGTLTAVEGRDFRAYNRFFGSRDITHSLDEPKIP